MKDITYPAWFNGPKGESAVFESADDVPKGWTSGAEQQSVKGEPAKAAPPKTDPPKTPPKAPAGDQDRDADGHPFDPALHAATKSKTKAGLWRMKVGVKRPDPVKPLDL